MCRPESPELLELKSLGLPQCLASATQCVAIVPLANLESQKCHQWAALGRSYLRVSGLTWSLFRAPVPRRSAPARRESVQCLANVPPRLVKMLFKWLPSAFQVLYIRPCTPRKNPENVVLSSAYKVLAFLLSRCVGTAVSKLCGLCKCPAHAVHVLAPATNSASCQRKAPY